MATVAEALGWDMHPWQREASDVWGEVREDGRMVYHTVIAIVPRRGGKTVLMLPTCIQRAAMRQRGRAWYTCQKLTVAEEMFREEWVPRIITSDLAPEIGTRMSNGSMRLTLVDLMSQVGLFPPNASGLHSKDADLVVVDEAWYFTEAKGQEMEAGFRPAQRTRPQRQRIIISAGGTEDSTWLLAWRAIGRRLVEEGRCEEAGIAYLEFYPPGELDPDTGELADLSGLEDREVWAATHPAVGLTIGLDALEDDYKSAMEKLADGEAGALTDFYRSTFNVFTRGAAARVIPQAAWDGCCDEDAELPEAPLCLGFDVEHERDGGAIVLAGRHADARGAGELVWTGPAEELADRVEYLWRTTRATPVADSKGPVSSVVAELRRRGVPVTTLAGEYMEACGEVLDDVKAGHLALRQDKTLDRAAGAAAKREVGDGWAWTRKRSGAGVAPLVALTVAVHQARQHVLSRPTLESMLLGA